MLKQPETNQFYRNGGNRYFRILANDGTTVTYQEYNPAGAYGRELAMPTATWMALYRNRYFREVNYFQSLKTGRWMERRDWAADRAIGADRYLTRQGYAD
jgi:hypothetical protein